LAPNEIRDTGLRRGRTYLSKVAGIDFPDQEPEWEQLLFFAQVRNVLAHRNGRVPTHDAKLRLMIDKQPFLSIAGDRLLLEQQFLSYSLETMASFARLLEAALSKSGV
jgi:hypothetical protein